ncbi:MAG: PQQ-binding-like beta-propeller repeat protein [Polyangiaceae bacterium]
MGSAVAVRLRHRPAAPGVWKPPPSVPGADAGPPSLVVGGPVASGAAVATSAARMLHGDRHHTHRAHGHGPSKGHEAWATDVGGAVEAQVTASPDGSVLYAATLTNELVALRRDGTIEWRVDLGGRSYGAPCVADDGTLYLGSDARKFFAVSAAGHVLWALQTDADADTSAVLAADGTIVFAAGKSLFSVRKGGDVAWRFTAKDKIYTSPALGDDGTVYVGSQDDHAYAITPNGTKKWDVLLGADVDGAPAIGDDGAIFFGSDASEVVRIEADGKIGWRTNVGGFVRGQLSIDRGGDVVVGTFGPRPREVRIDGKSGQILGAMAIQGTGAKEFGIVGGALEDDQGTLYFGTQDDAVYAVGRDGKVIFRFLTKGDVDAPLTLLPDGALVVPSDDGKIHLIAD